MISICFIPKSISPHLAHFESELCLQRLSGWQLSEAASTRAARFRKPTLWTWLNNEQPPKVPLHDQDDHLTLTLKLKQFRSSSLYFRNISNIFLFSYAIHVLICTLTTNRETRVHCFIFPSSKTIPSWLAHFTIDFKLLNKPSSRTFSSKTTYLLYQQDVMFSNPNSNHRYRWGTVYNKPAGTRHWFFKLS